MKQLTYYLSLYIKLTQLGFCSNTLKETKMSNVRQSKLKVSAYIFHTLRFCYVFVRKKSLVNPVPHLGLGGMLTRHKKSTPLLSDS